MTNFDQTSQENHQKDFDINTIDVSKLTKTEIEELIYSLKIKQIDLETQNNKLKKIQEEYIDLYEFAPVGYIITDYDCKIISSNLTFAKILGLENNKINGSLLFDYIFCDDIDVLHITKQTVISTKQKQVCELQLKKPNKKQHFVGLQIIISNKNENYLRISIEDIDARKNAELAKEKETKQLETIINTTAEGITLSDFDGKFSIFNNRIAEITGYSKEEANNSKNFLNLLYPEQQKRINVNKEISKLEIKGEVHNHRTNIKTKSGKIKTLLVSSTMFIHANLKSYLSIYFDITEQKLTERVNNIILNLYYHINEANTKETLSYGLEEGVKITNSDIGYFHLLHPDSEKIIQHNWSKKTKKNCSIPIKKKHLLAKKAGAWLDCFYQRKPIIHNNLSKIESQQNLPKNHIPIKRDLAVPVFENNKIVAILGVANKTVNYTQKDIEHLSFIAENVWNIVSRKKAELALKESEQQFKTIIAKMPLPMVIVKSSFDVEYLNDEFTKLFGYVKDDVPTIYKWFEYTCPDKNYRKKVLQSLKETYSNQTSESKNFITQEWELTTKDNKKRLCIFHSVAFKNFRITVINDITETKKTEQKLKDAINEKDVLMKEIHHRVKNNMQTISSLLYLQRRRISDKTSIDILKDSISRIKSIALIHEQIYQSENLNNIKLKIYIQKLISNISGMYVNSTSNITFETDIDNIILTVDKTVPIAVILSEIITNSFKYAFPNNNSGKIFIKCYNEQNNIKLIVGDTGIGFNQDFDFKQTKSLGLFLVRNITQNQLKGSIELNETEGVEFTIVFNK